MTRARFVYLGLGCSAGMASLDVFILILGNVWRHHRLDLLSGQAGVAGRVVLNLISGLLWMIPAAAVAAGLGLFLAVLIREWRHGDRYVLASIGALAYALGSALFQYAELGTRTSGVIEAACLGAVTGLIPGVVLVSARRRQTTLTEDAAPLLSVEWPAPVAPVPSKPNLVWPGLIDAALGAQAVVALLLAPIAFILLIGSGVSLESVLTTLRALFVMLSLLTTPLTAMLGAVLGWLIAMTRVGATERRARLAGGFLASLVPIAVAVIAGTPASLVYLAETHSEQTPTSWLHAFRALFLDQGLLVLIAFALGIAVLAGTSLGTHLFRKLDPARARGSAPSDGPETDG